MNWFEEAKEHLHLPGKEHDVSVDPNAAGVYQDITTSSGAEDPRDEKIAALETENAALKAQLGARQDAVAGFDEAGRVAELQAQGHSEADAITQARYEKQLLIDQAGGPH